MKSEEIDVIDFAAMKLRQMLRQEKCAATVSMLSNLLARYDAGEVAVAFWRGTPAWITVTVAE